MMICPFLTWVIHGNSTFNIYPLVNIQKAIEHDHLYQFIVDFPIEHGDFPYVNVYQRVADIIRIKDISKRWEHEWIY